MRFDSKKIFLLFFIFLLCFSSARSLFADEWTLQRIWAGLELFPTVLSADSNLKDKTVGGKLRLVLIYGDEESRARQMARSLKEKKSIRGVPVSVATENIDSFLSHPGKADTSAIFLTEKIDDRIFPLVEYGIQNNLIVFSPFDGDVEDGATAGIFIRDRILPYVNVETLEKSDIRLKQLFLKVAKKY